MSLKDDAENYELNMWRLLVLERDITRLDVQGRRESQECQDLLKHYRTLSQSVFGSVRQDREA